MSEFTSTSVLDVVVSDSSLRSARSRIEDELGGVTVTVDGPGRQARSDGGSSGALSTGGGVSVLDTLNDQLEVLEDIHDEIEKLGQSGLVAGGGGDGGGGGGGIASSITGGVIGRALPSLGGGAVAGAATGTAGTATGGALVGGGIGLGGVRGLQELGVMDTIRGAGQDAGSALGGDNTELLAGLAGELSGTSGLITGGAAALGIAQGDKDQAVRGAAQANDMTTLSRDDFSALETSLEKPEWLDSFTNPSQPQWAESITDPSEPEWLNSFTNPSEPQWLSELSGLFDSDFTNQFDIVLETGGFNFDLSAGELQSQIESEIDSQTPDIVDEAVREIRNRIQGV